MMSPLPTILLIFFNATLSFETWMNNDDGVRNNVMNKLPCCNLKLSIWVKSDNSSGCLPTILQKEGQLFTENVLQIEDIELTTISFITLSLLDCLNFDQNNNISPNMLCYDGNNNIVDKQQQQYMKINMGTFIVHHHHNNKHSLPLEIFKPSISENNSLPKLWMILSNNETDDMGNNVQVIWIQYTMKIALGIIFLAWSLPVRHRHSTPQMNTLPNRHHHQSIQYVRHHHLFSHHDTSNKKNETGENEFLVSENINSVDEWMINNNIPLSSDNSNISVQKSSSTTTMSFSPFINDNNNANNNHMNETNQLLLSNNKIIPTTKMYLDVLHPSWYALFGTLFHDENNINQETILYGNTIMNDDDLQEDTNTATTTTTNNGHIKKERMAIGALQCLIKLQQEIVVDQLNENTIGPFLQMLLQEHQLILNNFQIRSRRLLNLN
jgi:hypothetical protein